MTQLVYWVINEEKKLCIVDRMKTHNDVNHGVSLLLDLCCTGNTEGYKMYIHPFKMRESEASSFCHAVRQGFYSIGYKSAINDIDLYSRTRKYGKTDIYRQINTSNNDFIELSIEEVNEYVNMFYYFSRGACTEIYNHDEIDPEQHKKYGFYVAKNLDKFEYIIGTVEYAHDINVKNISYEKISNHLQNHCYGNLSIRVSGELTRFSDAMGKLREQFSDEFKVYLQDTNPVHIYEQENGDHKESVIIKHIKYVDM